MTNETRSNPYAPPTAAVQDIAVQGAFERASRGSRLGAALLDGIIIAIFFYAPFFLVGGMSAFTTAVAESERNPFAIYSSAAGLAGLAGMLAIAAINFVTVKANSQTVAKKLLGIKVVRADGSPATIGRIFALRNLPFWIAGFIPFVNLIVGLVDALMIFGEKQQCLHDRAADTIVIRA